MVVIYEKEDIKEAIKEDIKDLFRNVKESFSNIGKSIKRTLEKQLWQYRIKERGYLWSSEVLDILNDIYDRSRSYGRSRKESIDTAIEYAKSGIYSILPFSYSEILSEIVAYRGYEGIELLKDIKKLLSYFDFDDRYIASKIVVGILRPLKDAYILLKARYYSEDSKFYAYEEARHAIDDVRNATRYLVGYITSLPSKLRRVAIGAIELELRSSDRELSPYDLLNIAKEAVNEELRRNKK